MKWIQMINMYIDKIKNDLTNNNWKVIFDVLYQLQESCTLLSSVVEASGLKGRLTDLRYYWIHSFLAGD